MTLFDDINDTLLAAGFRPYGNHATASVRQWSRQELVDGRPGFRLYTEEEALEIVRKEAGDAHTCDS